jgi:tRNA threonylcarbamoyladenosine biosynthesis protein TsaE
MNKQITTTSAAATIDIGKHLGHKAFEGAIIALKGELGAGKTTLTKGIALGLGVTQTLTSPTFTLMKQYEGRLLLTHVDAYRLSGIGLDYDIEEAIHQQGVAVIEWAEHIQDHLEASLVITLTREDHVCTMDFVFDPLYQSMVEGL